MCLKCLEQKGSLFKQLCSHEGDKRVIKSNVLILVLGTPVFVSRKKCHIDN